MVICKYQKRCTATSKTPKSFRFKEIILHRGGKTLITRKSVYFKIALVYYPEARNVNGKINIVPCDKANKLIKVFSFLRPCWCLNEKVWQGTFLPPLRSFLVCFAGSRIKIDVHLGCVTAGFLFFTCFSFFFFPARACRLRGFSSIATNSPMLFLPWSVIWQYN